MRKKNGLTAKRSEPVIYSQKGMKSLRVRLEMKKWLLEAWHEGAKRVSHEQEAEEA